MKAVGGDAHHLQTLVREGGEDGFAPFYERAFMNAIGMQV